MKNLDMIVAHYHWLRQCVQPITPAQAWLEAIEFVVALTAVRHRTR